MFSSLRNLFKIPELRNKIFFTLFILALYRLGSYIPAPGIDQSAVAAIKSQAEQGGVLSYLQLFSGNALTQFAIFALGIMPYITASIILQILGVVIPKLEEWQQQGAVGQRKITQWTRYVTIGIAVLQSTGFVYLFQNGGGGLTSNENISLVTNFNLGTLSLIVLTFTAGTALLMWMGELITQRGIGNGMSLIIFSSVVSAFPSVGASLRASNGWFAVLLVSGVAVLLLIFIIYIENGVRKIPVQFAKRQVGRRMYGGQSTYIPLKVNQAGVIPIIFASAFLQMPVLLVNVLPKSGWGDAVRRWIDGNLVQAASPVYLGIFGLLIFGFSYFYTSIAFDPVQQADNLRKQGGFIPGIRPGPRTERYLAKVLNRITFPGALFIAFLALAPTIIVVMIVGRANSGIAFSIGGASLLIAVGVALELMKQIDGQLMLRNYEGFLSNKPEKR